MSEEDQIRDFLDLMTKVKVHGEEEDSDPEKDCPKCHSAICQLVQKGNPNLKCYKNYLCNNKNLL